MLAPIDTGKFASLVPAHSPVTQYKGIQFRTRHFFGSVSGAVQNFRRPPTGNLSVPVPRVAHVPASTPSRIGAGARPRRYRLCAVPVPVRPNCIPSARCHFPVPSSAPLRCCGHRWGPPPSRSCNLTTHSAIFRYRALSVPPFRYSRCHGPVPELQS
jgi:hypothetical protein